MGKLVLISILVGTFAVPALLARDASAVRGFRRLLLAIAALDAAYLLTVLYLYPRLG